MTQQLLGKLLKAVYSGAVAGLGALATVLSGSNSFGDVTDGQWVTIALSTLIAAGGTFGLAGWAGPAALSSSPPAKGPGG